MQWPGSVGDTGASHKRPRVVVASRPLHSRGILNEADMVDYLLKNWDVNVTVTKFNMGLAGSLTLMQETDVLIGMHGAGMHSMKACDRLRGAALQGRL